MTVTQDNEIKNRVGISFRKRVNIELIFLSVALVTLTTRQVFSGEAVFSQDGQRVYVAPPSFLDSSHPFFGKLAVIDIEKQSVTELDMCAAVKKEAITAVSILESGDLLFVTQHDAWRYNFQKKACEKLCSLSKGMEFNDLAYDPKTGSILFSTCSNDPQSDEADALVLEHGQTTPFPLRMPRARCIDGIAFSHDGQVFFGTEGDLWCGTIKKDPPDATGHPTYHLEAIRFAPLATPETTDATAAEVGAAEIRVTGSKLYVRLYRMHGTGDGYFVRLNKPASAAADVPKMSEQCLLDRISLYRKEISSVENIGENGDGSSYLCASPDGKRVFFRGCTKCEETDQDEPLGFYVIENDGPPRKLNIKLPF